MTFTLAVRERQDFMCVASPMEGQTETGLWGAEPAVEAACPCDVLGSPRQAECTSSPAGRAPRGPCEQGDEPMAVPDTRWLPSTS